MKKRDVTYISGSPLTSWRERIVAITIALLDFAILAVDEMLDLSVFCYTLTRIESIVFRVMRREWRVTTFALVFPAFAVGVVNSVNIFSHIG